jgi:dolichol-phosphate mannosyltransferase
MTITTIIPVYNEVESLNELHGELSAVAREQGYDLDMVFVDDGSRDGSWDAIRRLATADPRVRGIRFRRNFGKAAALDAGFRAARGNYILTLDADLQDDPREIPRFIAELQADRDLVVGWKQKRHDPWHKTMPSLVFNTMVSKLTGVELHDHNCGLKGYRRDVTSELRLYGEMHRFVPALAAARGYRVGELVVHHRPRKFGYSKYGVRRFIKGFLDLLTVKFLTDFGRRPLHLLGTIALPLLALGGLGTVAQLLWGAGSTGQLAWIGLWLTMLVVGSVTLLTGLLAELIVSGQVDQNTPYSIVERTPRVEEHHPASAS